MTHLDTSFLVDLLRESARRTGGPATKQLAALADEPLGVAVHVACELYAGAELSADPERERTRVTALLAPLEVLVPDDRFPTEYGRLLATLRRRGEVISRRELLIATAAIVDAAPLVTRNAREFDRVPGLDVRSY